MMVRSRLVDLFSIHEYLGWTRLLRCCQYVEWWFCWMSTFVSSEETKEVGNWVGDYFFLSRSYESKMHWCTSLILYTPFLKRFTLIMSREEKFLNGIGMLFQISSSTYKIINKLQFEITLVDAFVVSS